ncbi:MAG: antibiotic biosynthesis monooxygenase [Flavobacteriaceae bacterium]
MIIESNDVCVVTGDETRFESSFTQVASLLLRVPGCKSAELLRCVEEPGRYQVRICWARLEDHVDIYPKTSEALQIRALLAPLIASARGGHFEIVA